MITTKEADERVARGADWFDLNQPKGWDAKIDEKTLDVADPFKCPLGQVTGREYMIAQQDHNLTVEQCRQFGFASGRHVDYADLKLECKILTAAWLRLLAARKVAPATLVDTLRAELAARQSAGQAAVWQDVIDKLAVDPVAQALCAVAGSTNRDWDNRDGLRLGTGLRESVRVDPAILAPATRDAYLAHAKQAERATVNTAVRAALHILITNLEKEAAL